MDRRRGLHQADALKRRRGRDRELEAGSSAHYDDPAYYSKIYGRRTDDVDFYVRLANGNGGPVLEYGVGNGRVALPIARSGLALTGVDLSRPMLADLAARLRHEPQEVRARIRVRRGDMRAVRLGRKYSLVTCPFNALLHLYVRRDFERFFARVRDHLTPSGRFVFDISVPNPHELVRDPERAYHSPRLRHPTTDQIVEYTERFDHDGDRQILFVMMEFTPVTKRGEAWATPLAHRQLYPQEIEALLHYNGLSIERRYGDFQGGPFDRSSDTLIAVCRLRMSR
jgi:SAM-dependent methyltransferase